MLPTGGESAGAIKFEKAGSRGCRLILLVDIDLNCHRDPKGWWRLGKLGKCPIPSGGLRQRLLGEIRYNRVELGVVRANAFDGR